MANPGTKAPKAKTVAKAAKKVRGPTNPEKKTRFKVKQPTASSAVRG